MTLDPGSKLINSIAQNAGKAHNTGIEIVFDQRLSKLYSFNVNFNGYRNTIDAFSIENVYPVNVPFYADKESNYSGNLKLSNLFRFPRKTELQLTATYLAPDIVPQGKTGSRFAVDLGAKKSIQNAKGEVFVNVSDLFNTMRIKKDSKGSGFRIVSTDYYETQVIRAGYSYKF